METAQGRQQAATGAFAAFARFVLCGGGVGLVSSFAVAALASWISWALANAVITVVSTLLATELHARFTFGAGRPATWRQHAQSAGSAAAVYAVTCAAMLALHQLVAAPGAVLEQIVYLSASALAGVARFAVLRLVVFARNRSRDAATSSGAPLQAATESAKSSASGGTSPSHRPSQSIAHWATPLADRAHRSAVPAKAGEGRPADPGADAATVRRNAGPAQRQRANPSTRSAVPCPSSTSPVPGARRSLSGRCRSVCQY